MSDTETAGTLRVGLIGCGKMGLHHLRAIAAQPGAAIVGVADPVAGPDELASLIPAGTPLFNSANALLEGARPDVVHIVTPPASHADLSTISLEAGAHVYVEKPFTLTREEAARVLALAGAKGLKVCAGHQVLFETPALAVWDSLPAVGRVVHIESYFSFRMVRRTITPGEQVRDILPHAVYPVVEQLRTATGLQQEPIEVCGLSVDPSGEAYALLRLGVVTAVVMVSLSGRPVEQYQQIVGTNGSLRADYIAGALVRLVGPGTGPGALLTPFRRSARTLTGATRGIGRLVFGGGGSYPGLRTLTARFYESIRRDGPSPISPRSILDTVGLCERIGDALSEIEREHEEAARARLHAIEAALPPQPHGRSVVLVTGGTGLLGESIARALRNGGFPVRVLARRIPPFSRRVAGVEYVAADLAQPLPAHLMKGVGLVVHAAAETAGGKTDHQRNSVDATRHVLEAAARSGVASVLHVSSLAILKTSRQVGGPLDERTPVDVGNLARGPYVWGKAESETLARRLGAELNLRVRIVRPGPLVDFAAFQPPGRLGREIGPLYVAVGPRRAALSVCDVTTAARVVGWYATDYEAAPDVLNLVEAPAPTRRQLLERYRQQRPDLSVLWLPAWLLRLASGPLKLLQRLVLGAREPVDVAAAFSSEPYRTDLAEDVIRRATAQPAPVTVPALIHQ